MMDEQTQPVLTLRLGRVRADVWANKTADGTRYNVTPTRPFKAGGARKESTSASRGDLLALGRVLDQAHDWIWKQTQATAAGKANEATHRARLHLDKMT